MGEHLECRRGLAQALSPTPSGEGERGEEGRVVGELAGALGEDAEGGEGAAEDDPEEDMSPMAIQRRRRALRGNERLQGLVRNAWGALSLEDSGRLGREAYTGMCVRLQTWIAPGLQNFKPDVLFGEDAPDGAMPWGEFQDAIFSLTEAWVDRPSERAHADFLGAMLQAAFPSASGAGGAPPDTPPGGAGEGAGDEADASAGTPGVGRAPPGEDAGELEPAAGEGQGAEVGQPEVMSFPAVFEIMPEGFRHKRAAFTGQSVGELKADLSRELRLPLEALGLMLGDQVLAEETMVYELELPPSSEEEPVVFELLVEYAETKGAKARAGQLPHSIDVEIDQGPGNPVKLVQIFIDAAQTEKKPYMGGFRNKRTGSEYHHACTQTPRQNRYTEADRKNTRETQTYEMRTRTLQTVRECATQMERPGLLLDSSLDRDVTPGSYMTAERFLVQKEEMALIIQRHTRGWFARRVARHLRKMQADRLQFQAEEQEREAQEEEERRKKAIERRMKPRNQSDFEILNGELEAWRLQETQKIQEAGLHPEEQHLALQQLLHKETKLLQTIDRLKISANADNRAGRIRSFLKDMSVPKRWEMADGSIVEVHTPFTTRARELMQLYNGLQLPLLTTDERLDVLLHVKWTVKEFDCNLTREVVELIDREADLLNRGRNPKSLDGLRRRISNLFLAFIETPEFNPEAQRYQVMAGDFDLIQEEGVQA